MNAFRSDYSANAGLDIAVNLKRNELFELSEIDKSAPKENNMEFWFIIDCSGSMNGSPIQQAKKALKVSLVRIRFFLQKP